MGDIRSCWAQREVYSHLQLLSYYLLNILHLNFLLWQEIRWGKTDQMPSPLFSRRMEVLLNVTLSGLAEWVYLLGVGRVAAAYTGMWLESVLTFYSWSKYRAALEVMNGCIDCEAPPTDLSTTEPPGVSTPTVFIYCEFGGVKSGDNETYNRKIA